MIIACMARERYLRKMERKTKRKKEGRRRKKKKSHLYEYAIPRTQHRTPRSAQYSTPHTAHLTHDRLI